MYSKDLFNSWLEKELKNYQLIDSSEHKGANRKYLKKGYLHFDPRYWLPERYNEFKSFISSPHNVSKRAFFPFLRVITNTPRFRYDEDLNKRAIEFKQRPISYASHFDVLIYSFYAHCLTIRYQNYIKANSIDDLVTAYRTDLNKCNIDFAKDAFDYIKSKGNCVAVALDIKGFFDNLNHEILKKQWLKIIGEDRLPEDQYRVLKSLTNYAYVNRNTLLKYRELNLAEVKVKPGLLIPPTSKNFNELRARNIICKNSSKKGIPQGSPISSVLSNIYMLDFDLFMSKLSQEKNFFYRRYCDDVLLVCDIATEREIIEQVYQRIERDLKLNFQKKKEELILFSNTHDSGGSLRGYNLKKLRKDFGKDALDKIGRKYYKNLQYLGFEFSGQNVYIRSSSMSRYFRKMKSRIKLTVNMAYGEKGKSHKIFKRKLYHKYTHLGKRNFISYATNAASEYYYNAEGEKRYGFNSPTIKKQIAKHFKILKKTLAYQSMQRAEKKERAVKE